jgi:hypothetical protein
MFASDHNHLLKKFWTWGRSPLAQSFDAFRQSWSQASQGLLWANPPRPLIPRVLAKIQQDKALVLVCLPYWIGKPWWPTVRQLLTGPLLVVSGPVFRDRWGVQVPPPWWKICFGVLSGLSCSAGSAPDPRPSPMRSSGEFSIFRTFHFAPGLGGLTPCSERPPFYPP